ncbi:hypothetical protein C482_08556 [Natrialba chahannaoensis JCM 10990]|uniref:Uncharacterized protein n=1 Tax=Natrialba chahannaoensis JCM 10990 TaxID=1227492 RepID=M0ATF8_9EURY|nr:hypothetical protein [Natrialba chahannaoensis]ELZ01233.1 hypothetical protein C482_08556 [Natrialba chahannaoensis JCM 10990]
MNAQIAGEDDEGIGVTVLDNCDVEHRIAMDFKGDIEAHAQDRVPDDPSERTNTEDERFSQARRYARYHVYRETGYDTLEPRMNPDRIAAVLAGIHTMDDEAFESLFDPFHRQVVSYDDPSVEPPIDPLEYVDREEFRLYMLDVYLEEDLEEIRATADAYSDELAAIADDVEAQIGSGGLRQKVASFAGQVQERAASGDIDPPEFSIEAVSDVHMLYYEDTNDDRVVEGDRPFDREPDARLEFTPIPAHPLEQFRPLIEEHLLCQIRDCYVGMGEEPPAQYRVLGHGLYKFAQKYRHFDCYPDYADPDTDVPGYRI